MNHPTPFAGESSKSSSKGVAPAGAEMPDCEDVLLDDVADEEEEEEEIVAQKKASAPKKAGSSKKSASASSSKGKGKAK